MTTETKPDDDLLAAGDDLAESITRIRYMLYGLALDARQAEIAQRAIDKAIAARARWLAVKEQQHAHDR